MEIYFAGAEPAWRDDLAGQCVLVAYDQPKQLRILDEGWSNPIMLDSGAFAIWRHGITHLTVESYRDFLIEKAGRYTYAIAFDVIQGTAEQNLANLDVIEAAGLRVLPVFHEGDDWQLLAEYLRRGYDYVALAGTVNRGKADLVDWVLDALERYPPGEGLRYHGLGMTQPRIISYLSGGLQSVDSASWLNFARFGAAANLYLLRGRSPAFNRRLGIQTFLDIPQIGGPPSRDGQLKLLKGI